MTYLESLIVLNSIDGIGSVRLKRLLSAFKDPIRILKAHKKELQDIEGISEKIAENIVNLKGSIDIKKEFQLIQKENEPRKRIGYKNHDEGKK